MTWSVSFATVSWIRLHRRCGAAFYRQESLRDRHGNLAVFERHHRAVALDDAELAGCRGLKSCLLSYIGIRV